MSTAGTAVMEEPAAGSEAWPLSTGPEAIEEFEEVPLSAAAGLMSTAGSAVMVEPAAEPVLLCTFITRSSSNTIILILLLLSQTLLFSFLLLLVLPLLPLRPLLNNRSP